MNTHSKLGLTLVAAALVTFYGCGKEEPKKAEAPKAAAAPPRPPKKPSPSRSATPAR